MGNLLSDCSKGWEVFSVNSQYLVLGSLSAIQFSPLLCESSYKQSGLVPIVLYRREGLLWPEAISLIPALRHCHSVQGPLGLDTPFHLFSGPATCVCPRRTTRGHGKQVSHCTCLERERPWAFPPLPAAAGSELTQKLHFIQRHSELFTILRNCKTSSFWV